MGSVVNSMPIDVGSPGTSLLPGGNRFYWDHVNRSELVYLGADDGMLHAFYASNGKEAFAFIPADMVPMIAKIYAQGGQRYSPSDHAYGLSGSPKVKNLCVANCKVAANLTCSDDEIGQYDPGCPDWRTILVMSEGPGGNHPFALDITEPIESGAPTLKDSSLLWHVGYKHASGIAASDLGETDSVPAFAFHRTTNMSDSRVLMASGYPFAGSSTTSKLIDAMVWDGSTPSVAGPGATISGSGGCDSSTGQEFAVVADVAVARDNFHNGTSPTDQNLLAAYVADTWGKLHQYAPSYSPVLDKGGAPLSLGCTQPLHFSPAVVQLNRNNSNDPDNSVYLGQVTNSILDPNTVGSSFPASMLVVAKLTSIGSAPPALEQTFGSSGLIKLVADDTLTDANRLCGVTTVGKTSTASTCGSGGSWLPATARPTGTPVAVVRTDGTGFQLFTTWYDPPKANWDNCPESSTNGNSYVTLHEFLSAGTWAQIAGREYPNQYVTGVQFVGTTIFITFGTNSTTPDPTTDNFGQNFQPITSQSLSALSGDRFIPTAWTERMDAE
jgi:Tfp pilus assembly protein, tip-associated adhesin PilY1